MELRLIIPPSPAPGRYDIETGYSTLSSPRYRSREIVSSVSNPEYQTAPYDRLEITIRERSVSSRKHGHHRIHSGNLVASKSTPNLKRPLENAPRPPPPPPIQPVQSEWRRQQSFSYSNSDTSKVSSTTSSPWSNQSSSGSNISPLTPDNGQMFFLPSFQEQDAGLAIEFEPLEPQSPGEPFWSPPGHDARLSSHQMVYELEDTSKSRLQSPIDQLSPISLLEKPLPLLPCPRSLEKKIYASESYAPPSRLKKQNLLSRHELELRSRSLHSDRKGPVTRHVAPQTYSNKSSSYSTQATVPWARDYRPTTGTSKVSFRHLQPDTQVFHPQRQMEEKQGQRKKKHQKPFSIHLGRLHLVFGSTKQELADSRRNAGMYSDFERSHCQDSRGRIQHV